MIAQMFSQHSWMWPLVWQSTLCLAAGLGGSFVFRRRPVRAHQFLLLMLIAVIVTPALTQVVRHYEWGLFPEATETMDMGRSGFGDYSGIAPPAFSPESEIAAFPAAQLKTRASSSTSAISMSSSVHVLYWIWFGISTMLVGRLVIRFVLGHYLTKRSVRVGSHKLSEAVAAARIGLSAVTDVIVRSTPDVHSPVIWCWGRHPVILIPQDGSLSDSDCDWRSVIRHELAHWERRDHISGLLVEVLVVLLPWQPLLWWARRRLIYLSEQACDDWAIDSGRTIVSYAKTLVGMTPQRQAELVPSMATSKENLARRVERILRNRCGNPRSGARWSFAAVILSGSVAAGIAFAQTRAVDDSVRNLVTHSAVGNAAAMYEQAVKLSSRLGDVEWQIILGKAAEADSSEVANVLTQVEPILALLNQASKLQHCDWGVQANEEGVPQWTAGITKSMGPARVARFHAQAHVSASPDVFTEDHLAMLALARNVGFESIHSGIGIEAMAIYSIAQYLPNLTQDSIESLQSQWIVSTTKESLQHALGAEDGYRIDEKIQWALKARQLGLEQLESVLLQAQENGATSSFANDLRLGSIVRIGGSDIRIGLEEKDGAYAFQLKVGERKRGIELVRVDFEREEAILFKNGQAALVKLRAREILPWNSQFSYQKLVNLVGEETAREIITSWDALTPFVAKVEETSQELLQLMERVGLLSGDFGTWDEGMEESINALNPLGKFAIQFSWPAIKNMVVQEATLRAKRLMLDAAMTIRLEGKDALQKYHDPFGDGPFGYQETTYGFRLESKLVKDGEPVTLDIGK